MGENTKIAWCHHTFNPWWGCTKVSPGCANCYAEEQDKRKIMNGETHWGPKANRRRTGDQYWREPLKWDRKAADAGERRRLFCASMADVCDDHPSIDPQWRIALWKLIDRTPNLDWLLLTKRPENFDRFLPGDWGDGRENVWLGVTAEDQKRANQRIPILINTPAAKHFISAEPLLEEIDLTPYIIHLDWVIVGGESGRPRARAMPLHAPMDVREQCQSTRTAFFFKQTGTVLAREMGLQHPKGENPDEWPEALRVREIP